MIWNAENAAHLLRRTGFSATPAEVMKALKSGPDATIAALWKPDKSSDKLTKKIDSVERLQGWWLRRMATTKTPFAEKLALFWHNHFATGIQKVQDIDKMHQQIHVLRTLGLGKFRDLATAVAKTPAMIIWLDNDTNVAGNPNQNFARELMELFTTGVLDKNGAPNYTETDVEQSARAFTGWQYDGDQFFFNEGDHDGGSKTFKGHTGNFDGVDIINFLVVDDATARRLAFKLFGYFAYDVALSDALLQPLVDAYLQNDTSVRSVLDVLFRSDAFYSPQAKRAHVRGPAEFLVSAARHCGATFLGDATAAAQLSQDLGQALFAPPSVFGWKEGLAWTSTAGVLNRAVAASRVATSRGSFDVVKYVPKKLLGAAPNKLTPEQAVDRLAAALDLTDLSASTRAALAAYLQQDSSGTPADFKLDSNTVDTKVRGALALLLGTPEFQLS